jgi:hypothetical protein
MVALLHLGPKENRSFEQTQRMRVVSTTIHPSKWKKIHFFVASPLYENEKLFRFSDAELIAQINTGTNSQQTIHFRVLE